MGETISRYGRSTALGLAIGITVLALPSAASAQAVPDASCPGPHTAVTGGSDKRFAQTFTVVNTGTLTSASIVVDKFAGGNGWTFSINALAGGAPTDVALASTAVPESSIPPNDVSTVFVSFAAPLAVEAGQQYALVVARAAGQLGVGYRSGDVCPGALFESSGGAPFAPAGTGALDAVFTVFVEPTPPDTIAPAATITKGPPDKTKRRTATFEFTGTDAGAIAGFQCKLDAAAFVSCTSPYTVKVRKGKHTFQVQAVDQAGNVGQPATDTWKRKKKKR